MPTSARRCRSAAWACRCPAAPRQTALDTLTQLLHDTGAQHIVFLGDLLHAARSRTAATTEAVAAWRARHAGMALTLVRGNHDRHAGDPPAEWQRGLRRRRPAPGALALVHHPHPVPGAYVLAGHVHPAVVLGGRAHDRLRLPCFHFGAQVGVLPAFGDFTGMHVLPQAPGDRVFAIAQDSVLAVPVRGAA